MNKQLKEYILKNIKTQYATFDKAHNIQHFNFVTKNCIKYGKILQSRGFDIDLEIAYVVGAYHDIGIKFGRENHPKSSGKIVRADEELKKYFSNETIEIIAQATEDHTSHLGYEPRSIYGKLVADADRNNSIYLVFARPIKFGLVHDKHLNKQQQIESVYNFVLNKYGKNGYVHYWLDIDETKKCQDALWELLDNKPACLKYIEGILDEITKGIYKHKK